MLQVRLAA